MISPAAQRLGKLACNRGRPNTLSLNQLGYIKVNYKTKVTFSPVYLDHKRKRQHTILSTRHNGPDMQDITALFTHYKRCFRSLGGFGVSHNVPTFLFATAGSHQGLFLLYV